MFLLAILDDDGVPHYWSGGEIWSIHPEDAARFVQEVDADATIDLFKKAIEVSPTIHVVSVP